MVNYNIRITPTVLIVYEATTGEVIGLVTIKKNDVTVGTRDILNLIEGSSITLTVLDDAVNSEVDITITSEGEIIRKNSGANVGTRRRINFIEGANVTLTIVDDAPNEEVDVTIAASGAGGDNPLEGPTAFVGWDAGKAAVANYWFCDGVADDVQIQAALDYVEGLGGGSVELERGLYDITQRMEVGTDCTLFSHGDAELRLANGTGAVYVVTIDGNRGCLDNLIINGNKDNNVNSNGAGSQSSAHYGVIKNCEVKECDNYSIHTYKSDFFEIRNNYIHDGDVYGIALYGEDGNYCISNLIDGNRIDDVRHGIKLVYTDACTVSNNQIEGNSPTGVGIRSEHVDGPTRQITIVGNTLRDGVASGASTGISFDNDASALSSTVTIIGNTIEDYYYGISIAYDYATITGNILVDSRYAGIYIAQTGDFVHVEGNYFDNDGIHTFGDDGVFQDNYIIGGTANSPAGIYVRDGDNNYLDGNTIRDVTGDGIEVLAAATNTRITHTNRIDNCTNILVDGSASTILDSLPFPFVEGSVFLSSAPFGWEIDVDTEYAIALCQLPDYVQKVQRWKIWATSLVAEVDAMRLQIEGYGGTSNEPYSTETVAVADHPSETTNFAGNDVIYWQLDAGDDVDLDDMVGGDLVMIKVLHEAAGGSDCATDAVFATVEIEYI